MKHTPERTCLGCGAKRAPHALLRLVCSPQGMVCLDRSGRAPGRGAYVCGNAICLRKALKPARLAFAFKHTVGAPTFETLCEDITTFFHARLETCLQLACRAGMVVSGYAALQKALALRRVVYMVLATDIARARAEEYRTWCERQNIAYISLFSKEALGGLMGKASRSAIGFTAQHLAEHWRMLLTAVEQWYASLSASEGRATFFTTAS